MKVVYEVEIRDKDVSGNAIDTKALSEDIFNEITKFWDIKSITMK